MVDKKIKVAICGYGNLGKGVEKAIAKNPDMELSAIFTRRDPKTLDVKSDVMVIQFKDLTVFLANVIDVVIMCGGSATDLPKYVPAFARYFCTVDSFDTHAKIPEYFDEVNKIAKKSHKTSIISVGWDPGLFSKNRLEADAILPGVHTYTFWGNGVSQGHSDAIRRIEGVKDARQYTIPIESAMERVRNGENPELSPREKHFRECFVVAEDGADRGKITSQIVYMPNYFADYDTEVHYISEEEMKEDHSGMPHGGSVIACGETGENKQVIEYSLKLDSNPEFTGSVLVAYARACYRMHKLGLHGAKTVFDVSPAMLSLKSQEEMLELL